MIVNDREQQRCYAGGYPSLRIQPSGLPLYTTTAEKPEPIKAYSVNSLGFAAHSILATVCLVQFYHGFCDATTFALHLFDTPPYNQVQGKDRQFGSATALNLFAWLLASRKPILLLSFYVMAQVALYAIRAVMHLRALCEPRILASRFAGERWRIAAVALILQLIYWTCTQGFVVVLLMPSAHHFYSSLAFVAFNWCSLALYIMAGCVDVGQGGFAQRLAKPYSLNRQAVLEAASRGRVL